MPRNSSLPSRGQAGTVQDTLGSRANSDGGYVRLYRRMWEHPAFRTLQEASVFAWMVSTARWRSGVERSPSGPLKLMTGELIVNERQLSADFGLHRNVVRRLLRELIANSMIEVIRDQGPRSAGTKIAILNYHKYQSVDGHTAPDWDQGPGEAETAAGPRRDQDGTTSTPNPSPDHGVMGREEREEEEVERAPPSLVGVAPLPEPDLLSPAKVLRMPPDGIDAAVAAWNAMARECGLSVVRQTTDGRRRALRLRLRVCGGLEGWTAALGQVRASPFLLGQNGTGWKADFDFVLQAKSFTRLVEGAYGNRGAGVARNTGGKVGWMAGFMGQAEPGAPPPPAFDIDGEISAEIAS